MQKGKSIQSKLLNEKLHDEQSLRGDLANFELPDIEDIPGQKKNQPDYKLAIIPDATASSADEEAFSILSSPGTIKITDGSNQPNQGEPLQAGEKNRDEEEEALYQELSLEKQDLEGNALNEKSLNEDLFGEDLDSDLVAEEDEEDK